MPMSSQARFTFSTRINQWFDPRRAGIFFLRVTLLFTLCATPFQLLFQYFYLKRSAAISPSEIALTTGANCLVGLFISLSVRRDLQKRLDDGPSS
jgi:hypothetical protein